MGSTHFFFLLFLLPLFFLLICFLLLHCGSSLFQQEAPQLGGINQRLHCEWSRWVFIPPPVNNVAAGKKNSPLCRMLGVDFSVWLRLNLEFSFLLTKALKFWNPTRFLSLGEQTESFLHRFSPLLLWCLSRSPSSRYDPAHLDFEAELKIVQLFPTSSSEAKQGSPSR